MTALRPLTAGLALAVAAAAPASAHDIDIQEHRFGATNVNAQTGNGGLSVGVSARGELTVLSWPSPTFYEQLDYESSADEDARSQPRFGADEDMGVFAGLWVETADGTELTWFRDEPWVVQQSYVTEVSGAVQTLARHDSLGLTVDEILFVDGERDALVRRARIRRDEGSSVLAASYVLYENAAPAATKPDDLATAPLADFDDDHDLLAWWEPEANAVVHGTARGATAEGLAELMAGDWDSPTIWQDHGLALARTAADGDGAFLAFGGATAPDSFQIGREGGPCTGDGAWSWAPQGAFVDIADGTLGGSPAAGCSANAALLWELDFASASAPEEAIVDSFVGLGATSTDALDVMQSARADGFDAALARTDAAWEARAATWAMPDGLDPEFAHFSRRALLAILQGTDRDATATVAAFATQPSYHHDWPRDSVFFDLAMDLAGEYEFVTRHKQFLAGVQNPEAVLHPDTGSLVSPPGAWFMNYYADGQPSTTSFNAFEIDQVGLMLWGIWAHAAFAPNDEARRATLAGLWPTMEAGARLLAGCVADDHPAVAGTTPEAGFPAWYPVYEALGEGTVPDADARRAAMEAGQWESLRPCRANEDDNPLFTVSIYSTVTTRMGLLAAARTAELLCLDATDEHAYWAERAHELAAVAFSVDYDEDTGAWAGERPDWVLWPEPLSIDSSLDELFSDGATPGERRLEVEAFERAALDAFATRIHGEVDDAVNLVGEGAAYENKKTLQLGRYWSGDNAPDGEQTDDNMRAVYDMAVTFALPGTRHVGEVWANIDDDGDGVADRVDQRVSTPHLWAATLSYLSAMAIARPELFEALESPDYPRVCVSGEEPREQRAVQSCGEDCNSTYAGPTRPGVALLMLMLGAALARTRRRQ